MNLGSQKTLPFRLQDFPLLLLSTFHLPDFFWLLHFSGFFNTPLPSFVRLLNLRALGAKKGCESWEPNNCYFAPSFFSFFPSLDIGS